MTKEVVKSKVKTRAEVAEVEEEEIEEVESNDDDDDDEPPASTRKPTSIKQKSRPVDPDDDDDGGNNNSSNDGIINLSTADENAKPLNEVVPKGKYHCQVVSTEYKEYKTGSKGMQVVLEVIDGEFAKSKKRKSGKKFYHNVVLSAKAADLLKTALKALGVDRKIYNSSAFSPRMLQRIADSGDLLGNEIVATVSIRMYNDEKTNTITRLQQPSDSDEVAESGAKFMDND
jgi:Protein of unknown function (DUF669)